MFIVDDILRFPVSGIWFVMKEIHNAAQQELQDEGETIRQKLREYYMLLDSGKITEEEFDRRECEMLDRLEKLETLRRDRDEDRAAQA